MSSSVQTLLDHAILQSVAESYLDLTIQFSGDRTLKEVLRAGVNHLEKNPNGKGATRLTEKQITWFEDNYKVITHYPNDNTGFSATLFQNKTSGEYVLSFRSTEYQLADKGGDWERDGEAAADGDISKYGFALGQLSSMETFYSNLKQGKIWNNRTETFEPSSSVDDLKNSTVKLDVTGYSLGGHLSSAFTLMHEADVQQTYNYNAAGLKRGQIPYRRI